MNTMADEKIRQTLYLPPEVHDLLRHIAFAERVSQQELFREALDLLFEKRDLGSYDHPNLAKAKLDLRGE